MGVQETCLETIPIFFQFHLCRKGLLYYHYYKTNIFVTWNKISITIKIKYKKYTLHLFQLSKEYFSFPFNFNVQNFKITMENIQINAISNFYLTKTKITLE